MASIKYDVLCPKCKNKNRFKISSTFSCDKILDIINKNVFMFKCKKCNQDIYIEYPFKVESDEFIVFYTPTENKEIEHDFKNFMRVCDTFDDLKEKLIILNDNLNDIVIEFIKEFLINQLDENIKKDVIDIRYNGKDEENLLFSLIGNDQVIGCHIDFYFKMIKKFKFKKIKSCVLVDKYTYKKYYRMRLI